MKCLILAGGKGTRLYPTTKIYNKHLVNVYNKPMILYAIECIKNSGIRDIILSLSNSKPEQFMEFLGDGKELGVNLTYTIHGEPKGISYAINHAKHLLDNNDRNNNKRNNDKFMVYLGDNVFETDLSLYVQKFEEKDNTDCMLLLKKHSNPEKYGVVKLDEYDEITKLYEKPNPPPSDYIALGTYFFTTKFFDIFDQITPSQRGEYEITDAINLLIPYVSYEIYKDEWFDLGTYKSIFDYCKWKEQQL